MYVIFIWINLALIVKSELNIEDIIMPNYDIENEQSGNLKTKFKINRRRNRLKNNRIRLLEQYLSNKTVFLDGVAHHRIDESNDDIKLIKKIEMEFLGIIGMKGVKHIFKRDHYWRTWREVKGVSGNDIVCYKCQNVVRANCSNCHSGGYWSIEDKSPPCPYELFSLQNDDKICVVNYTEFKNIKSNCTTLIKFSNLFVNCDNPIETKYMIQRDFNAVSERYPNVICNRRENCLISTEYVINNEEIIFRIMNLTNNIIYSRIMKSGENNYACVNDCGYLNPNTKKVSKNEKSLLLNLLDRKLIKKKRENDNIINNIKDKTKQKSNSTKSKSNINKIHLLQYENKVKIKNYNRFHIKNRGYTKKDINYFKVATISDCKRLEAPEEEFKDDSENSDN